MWDFIDVIKLRTLKRKIILDYLGGFILITRILIRVIESQRNVKMFHW